MKFFDKPWIQLRCTKNKVRNLLRTTPIRSSSSCTPIGFTIRFDDLDLPGTLGIPDEKQDVQKSKNRKKESDKLINELSSCITTFGKLPTHIICLDDYANPRLGKILLFLKRLDIPTTLSVSNGSNTDILEELVDLQIKRLYFHLWGLTDETIQQTCPTASFNASEHQLSLENISKLPFSPKSIILPWIKGISMDLEDISMSLKESSFENIQLCAPYFSKRIEDSVSISQYKKLMTSFDTTPSDLYKRLKEMHRDHSVEPSKSPNFAYVSPVGSNHLEISIFGKRSYNGFPLT